MNNISRAQEIAESFLNKSTLPPSAEMEVVCQQHKTRSFGWSEGKPNLQNLSLDEGLCVRVLENGAQGVVTTKNVDAEQASALASGALEMARLTPKDPHRRFAPKMESYPPDIPADQSLFQEPADEIREALSELEKKILKLDRRLKKVVKMNYHETQSWTALANSRRVALCAESSQVSFMTEILAEQEGETEVGWEYQVKRFGKEMKIEELAEAVARHSLQSLGGKPIPSGAYPVVVPPRVGTQLLSLVTDALSAEAVQLGRSFWRGKRGKQVASESVTLIDDPLLLDGVASAPFDDEGMPHKMLLSVGDGVLMDYFYDLRSAARDGRESNGRGIKSSLGALPHPGATNFYLKPGRVSQENLLASHKHVFLLTDVMGLHMSDPITGEFSLGASGALYEGGRFLKPVRGVTVAGTIGTLLNNVVSVADDLTWYGSFGAPSFLISSLTIAGT